MPWEYVSVRSERATCDICDRPIAKGDTAYKTLGERPARHRHLTCAADLSKRRDAGAN